MQRLAQLVFRQSNPWWSIQKFWHCYSRQCMIVRTMFSFRGMILIRTDILFSFQLLWAIPSHCWKSCYFIRSYHQFLKIAFFALREQWNWVSWTSSNWPWPHVSLGRQVILLVVYVVLLAWFFNGFSNQIGRFAFWQNYCLKKVHSSDKTKEVKGAQTRVTLTIFPSIKAIGCSEFKQSIILRTDF